MWMNVRLSHVTVRGGEPLSWNAPLRTPLTSRQGDQSVSLPVILNQVENVGELRPAFFVLRADSVATAVPHANARSAGQQGGTRGTHAFSVRSWQKRLANVLATRLYGFGTIGQHGGRGVVRSI